VLALALALALALGLVFVVLVLVLVLVALAWTLLLLQVVRLEPSKYRGHMKISCTAKHEREAIGDIHPPGP
jgi:uncharacterized protein (DUF58 family)